MAHVTLLDIPASAFIPDQDALLVAGDAGALFVCHKARPALAFDDTDEQAAISPSYAMPGQYAGGTLKADLFLYSASEAANGCVFDVFVEAITDGDAHDLEADDAFTDAANSSGDISLAGTAGYLVKHTVTLTNKDNVAVSDLVRFGVRRDTDHADDDATGDVYFAAVDIWEDV